jgi:hypothetical protein
MEAGGIPLRDWIADRFKNYDARIRSNHDRVADQQRELNTQGRSLVKIEEQLKDQGEDIAEMKNDMKWIKRGLFGAIAVGLMFTVAVSTLVIQVAH